MPRTTLSLLAAAILFSSVAAPAARATDSLHLLANVSTAQAEEAADAAPAPVKKAKSNIASTHNKTADAIIQNIRG
jgi:hypothetical protein